MKRVAAFRGVVLVGFMGSGKSSVGRVLARRFGAPFVDVDERIESAAGCRIRDLFGREGESAFRVREKAALRDVLTVKGCVIATGGGAFADEENRALLRSYAPVVYLEAAVETLLDRLAGDLGRPLLRGGEREEVVRELLSRREPGYRTADMTVRTDGRTVEDVAGHVADWIDRTGGRAG
ncbi:shikimate kinase [Candidatus Deferrimicrobium sp.]|jgi:shikimate kinase|uniref:shikimate kinase n=1 Tax=Candidatus Deferrimicrobium sp. TaxID=3060586 RepID=UPI002ED7847B